MSTKKVFIPFILARINKVEAQLSNICLDGWELVDVKGWSFFFRKTSPTKRMYFVYRNFDRSKGISFDYHRAKQIYSKRNSNLSNPYIFEIDTSKIDANLYSYIDIRNRYHIKFYVLLSIASLITELLLVFISSQYGWWYCVVFSGVVLYSLISLAIMVFDTARLKKHREKGS